MIDIETLDVQPTATILTIGAQAFDPLSEEFYDSFYARINIDNQTDRTVDDGTVDWWGKQPAAAQAEAFGEEDRVELKDALEDLHKLAWNANRVWANGIAFDMTILENAYKSFDMPLPWQYYKVMDARTIYNIANAGRLGNSHHALEDCVNQVVLLQKAFNKLGVKSL